MMAEPIYTEASASFDDAKIYRYGLVRRWAPGPSVLFVMLNPSTADATKLDPTLRRCLGFTRSWRWGDGRVQDSRSCHESFGAFEVCNLYAFRSTNPKGLWSTTTIIDLCGDAQEVKPPADPVGPGNDAAIQSAAKRADLVIVGWGTNAKPERERAVAQLLADVGVQPYAIHLAKGGAPGHPLYLPDTAKPFSWHARGLR